MKIRNLFLIIISAFLLFFSAAPTHAEDLVIYTYDSFNSKWGPGPVVFKRFEKYCRCRFKVYALGDSGTVLNRVILEKIRPRADVMIGLNNSELQKSFHFDLWQSYESPYLRKVADDLKVDPQFRVTPFDYGYLSFVYNSEKLKNPPQSLNDLLDEKYKNMIVIESPRTSSPGLSMLHWSVSAYGEDGYLDFWRKLKPNLLSVTDGWSAAYGMFTKGETPIVLSYATSPAYHLEAEKTERYRAAMFKEGHYRQIEFAGIVKSSKKVREARKFIDFMLTEQFQNAIPLTNWMYPVIEYQPLPKSYRLAPKPKTAQELDPVQIHSQNAKWLKDWSRMMTE